MAKSTRTSASYVAEARNTKEKKKNPFAGMTLAEMKKKYSSMTPAQRAANVQTFRDAAKNAPKSKPAAKAKPAAKTKPATKSSTGSGVTGQYRKKGDPGPAVVKKGSRTGASVDPRERSLRKNRQEAKSGSTTKGRANIKAQVDAASGSSRRNQRQVEERRRRARQRGAKRNLREMLAAKFNK